MKQARYISESETRVLEALALFKYMTASRFTKLGIVKHKSSLSSVLGRIKDQKPSLIGEISFGFVPGIGKLEKVFYLTSEGAKFVEENLFVSGITIRFPTGKSFLNRDYIHRMAVIDFQLEFYRWLSRNNLELVSFKTYFDKVKDGIGTALDIWEIGKIISDAEGHFKKGNTDYVFSLELIRGAEPGRIIKNLQLYMKALHLGVPSIKYNISRGTYVLCVFEMEETMKTVMERIANDIDFELFKDNFYFNTLSNLDNDFDGSWRLFDGEVVRFLKIGILKHII